VLNFLSCDHKPTGIKREAQRRKKQEELWEKSNPESAPTSQAPANADKSDHKTKQRRKIRLAGVLPRWREPAAP
jgi:hypothetical protein